VRAEEVKAVLESIGKKPTKRLGQNFLLDDSVVKRAVALADLTPGDVVLEIGPGLGNLTDELVKTGAKVVAVEQDPEFCSFLKRRFGSRVSITQADAVRAFLPEFNKVVSNLPYQISSPIIFKLLEQGFEVAVLMLQKEFAERMTAAPGTPEYGRLSVGVYYRASCKIMINVPPHAFWPQPKVDSCVVKLVPKPAPFKLEDKEAFFHVSKAIFSHRRKKVVNSLLVDPAVSYLLAKIDKSEISALPYSSKRAEELTPEMIGELSDSLFRLSSSRASDGTS
jgi:16S rRNA (adenine1518-N6/adenine1519-N6)-dimethyltransferase